MSAAGRRRFGRTRRRIPATLATIATISLSPLVPTTPGAPAAATTARMAQAAATDLIRSREWPLTALHVPQAWRWSKGAGVIVAVLDTGVDGHHPDLVGRVIQGPDYTGRGRRPGNRYWGRHGTAMASIIAGHGHGPGRAAGILGVAPQAKILSIRVTWENDDPERSDRAQVDRTRDAVAKGIRYAVDHGAQVINMSLGGGKMIYNGNPIEEDAVRYALGKGAILVASAGNDGAGPNRTNFPAAYPGVTAVGAVDKTMRPAKFTNRHDYVSIAAPGVDIISADAGRSYAQGTGTSPSAAIVAGIAALVRARCPALSPEQTRQALEQGTTHRPPGGRNTKVGAGVADALRAIYAGNRICKAPPPSLVAEAPPKATGVAVRAHVSLPRIGFLGGGAVLLVVSLFMSRRQRRRGGETYEPPPADPVETVPRPRPEAAAPRPAAPAEPSLSQPTRRQPHGPLPARPHPARPQPARPQTNRPPASRTQANRPPPEQAAPELLSAPIEPRAVPKRDYGDDPLGTGYIGPAPETRTPLADQSWETVLRGRRSDRPPVDGEQSGDRLPRFRRPPEP